MAKPAPRPLRVIFFSTKTGNEPAREWLLMLTADDRNPLVPKFSPCSGFGRGQTLGRLIGR